MAAPVLLSTLVPGNSFTTNLDVVGQPQKNYIVSSTLAGGINKVLCYNVTQAFFEELANNLMVNVLTPTNIAPLIYAFEPA